MGGCCSSKKSNSTASDEVVIELNSQVVNVMQCKAGKHGNGVSVSTSRDSGKVIVTGLSAGGILLGSCALDCDVAYWEVKIVKGGVGVNIGLKKFVPKRPVSLDGQLESETNDGKGSEPCWVLQRNLIGKQATLNDGDVIGIHWDQTDFPMVSFTLNGVFLPSASITRIRPAQDIFPAVSCADGSIAEVCFDGSNFAFKPIASKYTAIVCASSLI